MTQFATKLRKNIYLCEVNLLENFVSLYFFDLDFFETQLKLSFVSNRRKLGEELGVGKNLRTLRLKDEITGGRCNLKIKPKLQFKTTQFHYIISVPSSYQSKYLLY